MHYAEMTGVLDISFTQLLSSLSGENFPQLSLPLPKASLVKVGQLGHLLLHLEESIQLTPAVQPRRVALGEAMTERHRPLVEHKVDVLGLPPSRRPLHVPTSLAVGADGLGRFDDLDVEPRAKGGDVRHGEVVLSRVGFWRQGRVVAELGQAEGRQDGDDVGVVAEVEVEGLVEWEGLRVGVERGVDLGARVA